MSCWKLLVRRANLQTTGTIYNKETQLLAYADDIDIVSRNQSAVRDAYLALESVVTGDKHIEVVKKFVYLESSMTLKNDESL
jgi:hypothetical protein